MDGSAHTNGSTKMASMTSQFDVLIVGAGISGINAAYRVQSELPHLSYAILEARDAIGGTWDLFRYPGIRSDSDLFTFGFPWNPWKSSNPIASGDSIREYMRETARDHGIDSHILFHHRVAAADWSSDENVWSLDVEHQGQAKTLTARFMIWGTGYYNYHTPLETRIPGLESFQGQTIHPQFWPEDLDYTGKKIAIIGSGATAVTLLPVLAEKAAKVTMVQRSPTYILSLPNRSRNPLYYLLPDRLYRQVQRINWILISRIFFLFCQGMPWLARAILRFLAKLQLPKSVPTNPHFEPRYNPWDQRLCVCPDGDFYKSFHTGRADVKTGTIKTVTEDGILLESGEKIDSDIIVTATGLNLQIAGGAKVSVDGKTVNPNDKYLWHGILLQDLPNAAFVIGYANASWTLGANATARFVVRLLKKMVREKAVAAVPKMPEQDQGQIQQRPLLSLTSTYVALASKMLPRAGDRGPWRPRENYINDYWYAKYGGFDETLKFTGGGEFKLREKQL